MKKRKRMIAIVLAALTIALMLPMGSVQALKEKAAMRPEPETKPELWQSDENTFENKTSNSENADVQVLQTSEALDEEFGSEPPIASTGQKLENESTEQKPETRQQNESRKIHQQDRNRKTVQQKRSRRRNWKWNRQNQVRNQIQPQPSRNPKQPLSRQTRKTAKRQTMRITKRRI